MVFCWLLVSCERGFTLVFFAQVSFEYERATMKLLCAVMLVVGIVFADDDEKKENVGTVIGIDLGTTYSW